jgi:YhgE/Pip-like protein
LSQGGTSSREFHHATCEICSVSDEASPSRRCSGEDDVPEATEGAEIPQVRASKILRSRSAWLFPLIAGAVLVMLMTLIYFGSIVDPTAHLHSLPVLAVNEDAGAVTPSGRVNLGSEVLGGLTGSRQVTQRLAIDVTSLADAETLLNKGGAYAAVVIPKGFTDDLLSLYGDAPSAPSSAGLPTVELWTNSRVGTLGVSLATGVLNPALKDVSAQLGKDLRAHSAEQSAAPEALLASPLTVESVAYNALPDHSGLGLSAFYIALLITMAGFLSATIVNSSVDATLGYATTEIGPRWHQRLPLRISRFQTLIVKWVIGVVASALSTVLLLCIAVGVLGMNAPHLIELWLFAWFAATTVAIGTLVLFAALGLAGQLVALLAFVYLALASSGGTIPLQALGGFYRFVANFEPLRQILDGVRAILYFNAFADAGLDRGVLLTGIGLVFWLVVGVGVTIFYDRKGLHRMEPRMLEYVHRTAGAYPSDAEAEAATQA